MESPNLDTINCILHFTVRNVFRTEPGIFSLSRLQLQVEISQGKDAAERVLAVRQDSNFLLTTILWGNVGINVLLTLPGSSETDDGAIEYDAVLVWGKDPRIITGADIIGKLLKGISAQAPDHGQT